MKINNYSNFSRWQNKLVDQQFKLFNLRNQNVGMKIEGKVTPESTDAPITAHMEEIYSVNDDINLLMEWREKAGSENGSYKSNENSDDETLTEIMYHVELLNSDTQQIVLNLLKVIGSSDMPDNNE